MNDNWYIYVNKETLQVYRVSPALEADDECHVTTVDKEVGISFIHAPHLLNDYAVYFDGTKVHFIKRDKTKDVVVPFYYSPLMIDKAESNPDILVTVGKGKIKFTLKKEIVNYAMTIYGSVDKTRQSVEFYISAKNDPNHIIEIIKVDMMKMISQKHVEVPFEYSANDVSIFTRKIFDSYGLKKVK
jgi:hypothetical protein